MSIEVVLENAEVVEEKDDVKVLKYVETNESKEFKRLLKHLQLEKKAPPFPEVYFIVGDEEFKVEYGEKSLDTLIKTLEKMEKTIINEWAKFEEKLAKAKAKGKEPDAEPPVDTVKYVITAKMKGEKIEEIVFDKRIISELMPEQALVLRFTARL